MTKSLTGILKKEKATEKRPELPIVRCDPEFGLETAQVEERRRLGYSNAPPEPPTKTVGQIVLGNLLTYFNLVFFLLAACIIAVGSWRNLMFMPVVLANIAIGIIQELRSKRTLDKLTLVTAPKGLVIRNGARATLNIAALVRDDVVIFTNGNQIYADAEVISGEVVVNEALITGEADEIKKFPGDELLSGSFVISGMCRARLTRVGEDSYAAQLTLEAKKTEKTKQSEMMNSLSKLVKWIGIILFPFGAAMAYKEIYVLERGITDGVVSTVGALVGMIPEGLYLLTSLALAAGVLRLMQKKTMVQDLSCIETLARVDILCVDKTGTITENKMIVEDIALMCEERFIDEDVRMIMSDYVYALGAENETMDALQRYFKGEIYQHAEKTLPFSSVLKYGGVQFHEDEAYLLGAPDVLLGADYEEYRKKVEYYSAKGCRVLLLTMYDGNIGERKLAGEVLPIALILLNNKIRAEAPATFAYFAQQGVNVKVISGDNPMTVSEVARRAEIPNAERYIDARELDTDKKIADAALEYTVFGRVTPEQKRKLVCAMKNRGHTVAMTGDGVNDALALKEADCSVAMASGSEVAARISHIVLLDSNFASMPSVVLEGRRVINNIEKASSLYLVKNIFSFAMALITLLFTLPYPVTPAQLSLVSTITIGIPSFFLALEPNNSLVSGKFIINVLYKALPGAVTNVALTVGVMLFYIGFTMEDAAMSTICAIILAISGLLVLNNVCKPYTQVRKALMVGLSVVFVFSVFFLKDLFTLSPLDFSGNLVLVVLALLANRMMYVITIVIDKLRDYLVGRQKKNNNLHAGVLSKNVKGRMRKRPR